MKKKIISFVSALAAVAAVLPGMNITDLNTISDITANAADIYVNNYSDMGWYTIGDDWYYYDKNGNLVRDYWIQYEGDWYYLKPDGKMAADEWLTIDGKDYYLQSNGIMLANTFIEHNGGKCYLDSEGAMVRDQWVADSNGDYHYIDKDGFDVIAPELFRTVGVKTTIEEQKIIQKKTVGDIDYTLIFDLNNWDKGAKPEQIIRICDLFWYSYPTMRARFVKDESENKVTITIEYSSTINSAALCGANHITLNNSHFTEYQTDYDAVTHELGHTLQNRLIKQDDTHFLWDSWDKSTLENPDYVEVFADYCRYMYAYNDGYYNDDHWTPYKEQKNNPNTHNSIRFLIWLDYKYSDENCDIIYNFSEVCRNSTYSPYQWRQAWKEIFRGSKLENRDIDDVWSEYFYRDTRFSNGDAKAPAIGEKSPLINEFDIRGRLKELHGEFLS
ncbi:MAG: hypothetical protein K6G33_04485 [Ruminococcus sp.]|uniref:hypothetical protein n=1 Tax=Ruminococcus sp. TaxID=41978 RepID=UPI0025EC2EB3|nr:hypothetical protein [Ruminococcus sp.]MCR5599982.1 hypothetical protein [Ruminococcus sp.]